MGIEDGLDYDDLKQAVHDVDRFLCEIEHALERHGLKEQVLRWLWEYNVPSAPVWKDHPGKPADAEAIGRAAHPLRDDSDDEADPPPA